MNARRRAVIRVVIAVAFAELVLQAVEVRSIHHSATVTALGVFFPVLAVLSGLFYLWHTRGSS